MLGQGPGTGGVLVTLLLALVGLFGLRSWSAGQRRDRALLERAAHTDPLTGLANHRVLLSMMRHEISRHLRSDGRFVVVMLDLDGFKQVNDRYGHDAGDEILCGVADALIGTLRAQDTVARLGGDEFCVIAPETADPRTLAERVETTVAAAVEGCDGLLTSVGISLFPDDATSSEKLLRMADERLLAAKRRLRDSGRRDPRRGDRVRAAA